jgi:DNA-binding winged helix-turn-helix (wHTH) protein
LSDHFRFGDFELDVTNRRLVRGGEAVELSARYFDALVLMVSAPGQLITKERFLDEVWRGVPVTDEALTQCVRSLRRALGDEAGRPRFIATEPKHGYRFIAGVEAGAGAAVVMAAPVAATELAAPSSSPGLAEAWRLVLAGTAGGAVAGAIGGLIYGFAGASDPLQPGLGSGSIVLVLTCVTILVAVTGAAGVSLGVAAADLLAKRPGPWRIVGGRAGRPDRRGGGQALGAGCVFAFAGSGPGGHHRRGRRAGAGGCGRVRGLAATRDGVSLRRAVVTAGAIGAVAGVAFGLMGGRLFGGSLDQLAQQFQPSRLSLDGIGRLFGEDGFGLISRTVTGGLEGLLFAACLVGAMGLAGRSAESDRP